MLNYKNMKAMRRFILILCTLGFTTLCSAAMSNSKVRTETRFLTDKMAYELNLDTEQYNDVYEINYDFIYGIRYLMDDVLRGQSWALNRYYDFLDERNDDLRWVLSRSQYTRFMNADYFFRPVYANSGRWYFRVYITYNNRNQFYFPRPYHYNSYCGGHYRGHRNESYYRGRYNHSHYNGVYRTRESDRSYNTHRRSDFGSIAIRPGTTREPENKRVMNESRRSSSSSTERRESNNSHRNESTNPSRSESTGSSSRENSSTGSNENSRPSTRRTSRTRTESENTRSSNVRSSEGSSRRSSSSSSENTRSTRPTRTSPSSSR